MRVKLVVKTKHGDAGDTIDVSKNEAFGLIDSGKAVLSKDMTPDDYKQAGDDNGSTTKLRPNNSRRR